MTLIVALFANMNENFEAKKDCELTMSFYRKLFCGGILCLILFGVVVWVCLFREVQLEISPETTFITTPLRADGKQIEYFKAVELDYYPPNMKTDENGVRLLIQSFGVSPDYERRWPDCVQQIYEKLGISANSPPITFQCPEDFLLEYRQANASEEVSWEQGMEQASMIMMGLFDPDMESIDAKIYRPWTLDEIPIMANWLKANEPAIDLLCKAVRKPVFCVPMIRTGEDEQYHPRSIMECMNYELLQQSVGAFIVRANYRIGTGDIDGAIDDILACKSLGRHIGLGTLQEEISDSIGIAGSFEHQPTEVQLQRLFDAITNTTGKAMPLRVSFEKVNRNRRYVCLDAVQKMAWGNLAQKKSVWQYLDGKFPPPFQNMDPFSLKCDWNIVAQQVNKNHDEPSRFNTNKSSSFIEMLFPTSRSKILGDIISQGDTSIGNIAWAKEWCEQAASIDRLKAITLAMLIYEKQHQCLPPAWSVGAHGKPLHSWRVLLLPYLGQKELYEKIRLNEPWDSPHNSQFHDAEIPFYQCPNTKLKPGETTYSVAVGEKTAFRGGKGKTLAELGPGNAKLVLIFESIETSCWMDPTSETIKTSDPKGIEEHFLNPNANLGLRDGSVILHSRLGHPPHIYWNPEYFWTIKEKPDKTKRSELPNGRAGVDTHGGRQRFARR